MTVGVVLFPGSNCEADVVEAVATVGGEAEIVWHGDRRLPADVDAVVLPGGFAHGDYLRPGAIARFSPVMARCRRLRRGRRPGGRHLQRLPDPVLKRVCCPARCRRTGVSSSSVTRPRSGSNPSTLPSRQACATAPCCGCRSTTSRATTPATPTTLAELQADDRVVFRYVEQPEWLGRRHRRHLLGRPQRGGSDAPPRAGLPPAVGQHRRAGAVREPGGRRDRSGLHRARLMPAWRRARWPATPASRHAA